MSSPPNVTVWAAQASSAVHALRAQRTRVPAIFVPRSREHDRADGSVKRLHKDSQPDIVIHLRRGSA
jgi:hypothetical protein